MASGRLALVGFSIQFEVGFASSAFGFIGSLASGAAGVRSGAVIRGRFLHALVIGIQFIVRFASSAFGFIGSLASGAVGI